MRPLREWIFRTIGLVAIVVPVRRAGTVEPLAALREN
jgi:hypothetical protein